MTNRKKFAVVEGAKPSARCNQEKIDDDEELQDTVTDLFYDSVFDACPICSCNANIRSVELGLYVLVSQKELLSIDEMQQHADANFRPDYWNGLMASARGQPCTCGFSAVRHRALSGVHGLFVDDIREAAGGSASVVQLLNERAHSARKPRSLDLVDCARFLAAQRNLAVAFQQALFLGDLPETIERTPRTALLDAQTPADYVYNRMDIEEIDIALRLTLNVAAGERKNNKQTKKECATLCVCRSPTKSNRNERKVSE